MPPKEGEDGYDPYDFDESEATEEEEGKYKYENESVCHACRRKDNWI